MRYDGRTRNGTGYHLTFNPYKFVMTLISIICAFTGHWAVAFILLLLSDIRLKWS